MFSVIMEGPSQVITLLENGAVSLAKKPGYSPLAE